MSSIASILDGKTKDKIIIAGENRQVIMSYFKNDIYEGKNSLLDIYAKQIVDDKRIYEVDYNRKILVRPLEYIKLVPIFLISDSSETQVQVPKSKKIEIIKENQQIKEGHWESFYNKYNKISKIGVNGEVKKTNWKITSHISRSISARDFSNNSTSQSRVSQPPS